MGNNWIEWKGGDCPVPKGTLVDLRYRSNVYEDNMAVPALTFGHRSESDFWRHDSWGLDIIAWRLHQPEQAAWNGEGLPPEGIECEFAFIGEYRESFCRGKVIAYGESNVFMQHWASKNEFIQPQSKIKFRPIRTEAERKRDEATIAMHKIWHSVAGQETDGDLISIYDCLYNAIAAGKIPGVKLD